MSSPPTPSPGSINFQHPQPRPPPPPPPPPPPSECYSLKCLPTPGSIDFQHPQPRPPPPPPPPSEISNLERPPPPPPIPVSCSPPPSFDSFQHSSPGFSNFERLLPLHLHSYEVYLIDYIINYHFLVATIITRSLMTISI